jgi:hypothetical protein
MAICSQCGQEVSTWARDIFTGACPKCQRSGARPATLGCGTLFLIGLVVLFFSRPGIGHLESEVARLRSSVNESKQAVDSQTSEIRELRAKLERERAKDGAGDQKDKQ